MSIPKNNLNMTWGAYDGKTIEELKTIAKISTRAILGKYSSSLILFKETSSFKQIKIFYAALFLFINDNNT